MEVLNKMSEISKSPGRLPSAQFEISILILDEIAFALNEVVFHVNDELGSEASNEVGV